ncbi:hypothetical protein PMI04_008830 [Sphingobium sp. AP49]|uniref:hypothetical protein n=1 Tax=Sphingobium sp. AP49 TaxID=1144307 RepID=UPI00026EC8DC|nr:hypothetical protein [Sphingobium sp. AP49]WHO40675.1 hypothetical protein PMI04_008830 [Sphingobium sp. AP49]
MSIEYIRPAAHRAAPSPRPLISRDCGPDGCEVDWLASRRHEADLDIETFARFAMDKGWGDGLPLIPPTDARVRTFLAENDRYPDEVIGILPGDVECTVEKIVINAVMAGAPAASLELLIAMIASIADPDFELYGVNATTAPVYPAFVVNGPVRHALDIPYSYGCLGGVPGASAAIGRAIRLIMRNVAGQVAGTTSQTTFGSPGRIAGIVTGEWEEKSPWAPLGERRGIAGNAVTSFGTMGTMNILDTTSHSARDFLEMIGRSYAYAGCNNFSGAVPFGEALIALNPICAEIVGRELPNIEDVQEMLWQFASIDADLLNRRHRDQLAEQGRIRSDGRIYAAPEPKDMLVFVAGGLGGLHAACFHTFGTSLSQTKPVASPLPAQ